MREGDDRELSGLAAEAERVVAWLRLPAILLLVAGRALSHPNQELAGFLAAISVFSAWSLLLLVWVHRRPVGRSLALAATAIDVAAITVLALLSGGPFSQARLAYFLVPIAVAFRFQPVATAVAAGATAAAYVAQALAHPARNQAEAARFIAVHTGYLLWIGAAAVLLSTLLWRRTRRIVELAAVRRRLLADVLTAEERERRALAEGLHDSAIQNLLSSKHDLEEVAALAPHPLLERAERALSATVGELRETIFELHPYVLEQAGLEAALRSVSARVARRGGFRVHFDLDYDGPHPREDLLLGVARELLVNAAEHARAANVTVRLQSQNGAVELSVLDDGVGFDTGLIPERLADGHIGLASQRLRLESASGSLELGSAPGRGTVARARLPA
ncbi:MAG TPA: ATP-binding protein [Gaiellaceae bacterium]|nr:ATP-binding protein [Gaiellaceae bacterium]